MHISMRFFIVVLVASLGTAAQAGGPDGSLDGPPPVFRSSCLAADHARAKAKLQQFDRDGDGRLNPAEHRAMRRSRKSHVLHKYDRDGDGYLSIAERASHRRDRAHNRFLRLDRNRNGSLSRAEVQRTCSPLRRRFDAVDRNADGVVSRAEYRAALTRGVGQRRTGPKTR